MSEPIICSNCKSRGFKLHIINDMGKIRVRCLECRKPRTFLKPYEVEWSG